VRALFIHNNFPAQFGGIAGWLAQQGWDITFATQRAGAKSDVLRIVRYEDHREISRATHHYIRGTERAVITGQGFVRAAVALKREGYRPDVIVAHSGWGAGTFAKDVWPDSKYVQYAEWYYSHPHIDRTPHDPPGDPLEQRAKARIRNAPFWLDFSAADATICPTQFQADRFPAKVQPHITVLPDGVDTVLHRPGPRDPGFLAPMGIPDDARIVTYIARGMEPARGFPEFMRAAAEVQRRCPDIHIVVIGEDRVAYGPTPKGPSWKARMLAELDFDPARLHFTGLVGRAAMIRFLQASSAHVYLSAPFVLSWSFLEAMSCGAPMVAADNGPVREFLREGETGFLVDPTDTDAVASRIEQLARQPALARSLGMAARAEIVGKLDATSLVYPRHRVFLSNLVTGGADASAPTRATHAPPRHTASSVI